MSQKIRVIFNEQNIKNVQSIPIQDSPEHGRGSVNEQRPRNSFFLLPEFASLFLLLMHTP